jgi:hypothetical protein
MRSSFRPFLFVMVLMATLLITGWLALTSDAAFLAQPGTATPRAVRNEITFPQAGTVAFGIMRIRGTGLINDFQQYQLHIARHGSEDWQWLTSSYNVVRDGDLYVLNTTLFPDGFYDLRLRALQQMGNYSESFVRRFEIRNANPPTLTPTPVITETPDILATVEITLTPTPLFLSPIETPSPLATPTPTPESFIPGGQGIYTPVRGAVLRGSVRIVGTANGKDPWHRFQRYELYHSPTGQETWTWFFSSQNQHFNDTLYVLDTTQLPNGFYDLRLRIVYRDSNYDQYHVRNLRIDNDASVQGDVSIVRITSPGENSRLAGITDISGTIFHPRLQRWELYWAKHGTAPQEWLFLYRGDHQVLNDLIARIDLGQVTAGIYDLRLRVVKLDGNYDDYIIRRLHVALPTSTP